MSEFYFDVRKWDEDLARRGGRLKSEEFGPAGDDGTREREKGRDQVKRICQVCVCLHLLFSFVAFKILFSLHRIGLKHKKTLEKIS